MNTIAKKIASLLPELENRGEVYLFALAEREDVNRWDVILSSDWSDASYTAAIRVVASALMARLEPSELVTLSRVAILPSDSPDICEIPINLEDVSPSSEKVIEINLPELDVRRAYIFKARRPPTTKSVNLSSSDFAVGA